MTLIKNTLYFDGNAITQPIVVLAAYVVVFAALVTVFSWGRLLWWRAPNSDAGLPQERITRDEELGVAAVPPG
jgi:hypothetical protein